jgi:uncharacterized protein (TIGR02453 family)
MGLRLAGRLPTTLGHATVAGMRKGTLTGRLRRQGRLLHLLASGERDWFQAHRAEYQQGWAEPMAALLAEVRDGLRGAYGKRGLAAPKVFRLHRDVRFSKDKSPYKTHVAGWIPLETGQPTSPGATPAALYLQVGPGERFTGSGCWMLEPDALRRFRTALLDPRRAPPAKHLAALQARGFTPPPPSRCGGSSQLSAGPPAPRCSA